MAISKIGSNSIANEDLTITDGDLVFATANKGVVLGVTSNTDGNTIDDYEEGTHTVAATCSTSGTITLKSTHRTMVYTKVGRLVTCTVDARIDSVSSPTGALRLSLPFTVNGDVSSTSYSSVMITHGISHQTSQKGSFIFQCNRGDAFGHIHFNTTTNLSLQAENGGLGANDEMQFSITYHV